MLRPISPLASTKPAVASTPDAYRVMIVDDSVVVRGFMARVLDGEPSITILSSASNGQTALASLRQTPVDVIILDIEMPIMDGLTALPQLKAIDAGVQIIMASTLTQKNADISLKALMLGANDYIPKPSSHDLMQGADGFRRELVDKIRALGALARRRNVRQAASAKSTPPKTKSVIRLRTEPIVKPSLIAIGSSTGGPQALLRLIKDLGPGLSQPVVIAQHMPPSFTTMLAQHIARQCGVTCTEATEGEKLLPGRYHLAPGDFHLIMEKSAQGLVARLSKDPPENFCRPAVDPMLRSAVQLCGAEALAVILTGMGQDGLKGCEAVVKAGGAVVAQDEATSVVWGMPAAVANAGLCSAVLPLGEIAAFVGKAARQIR